MNQNQSIAERRRVADALAGARQAADMREDTLRAERDAARAGEERYRKVFQAMDDGFYIAEVIFDDAEHPLDHRVLEANRAFERHTGVTDPVGKLASELVPGMEQSWHDVFGRVALTGEPVRFMDGSEAVGRWFDVFVTRVDDGSRQVAILFRDVTARRLAEQLLQQRTMQFETLLNEAPLGVYLIDAAFRIRAVNPAALNTFTGIPDLIGRDFDEVMHILWPADRASGFVDLFRRTLETGEAFLAPNDTDVRHDSGVTEYYAWQINRIPLPEGGYGVVCYFRDISAQIRIRQRAAESEEQSREAQRQLLFVMDSMPQKIFTAGPGGEIDYVSTQWLQFTGLRREQVRDWGRTGFIHADDLAHTVAQWQHGVSHGEPIQVEHRFQRSDGEYRWHISRALPMRDSSDAILMWVGSSTDTHEQRQASHELQRSARALSEADSRKDEFLAMLAHELRNPLAPISNALQILQLTSGNADAVAVASGIIERQLGQMIRLVDELLDVSRISRGTIDLRLATVDLQAVLQRAVETSRPAIDRAQHQLEVNLPDGPVLLNGDVVRLVQVFGNLLNNAGKYTDPGGHIRLTATREGAEVSVAISDTGVGIPPQMLRGVFEMFYQVDPTQERSRAGLGIGLTLVQRLVALHGGSVTALSDGPGLGSTFVVRLPVLADRSATIVPDEPVRSTPVLRRRVLIADDNADSASSLALYLQLIGYDTRTAHDGAAAVEEAERFRPHLVLLDIGMPKLNGYDAARRIRGQSWGQAMTLVALSGWGQDEDRRKSAEAGLNEHMVKPIDHAALATLLAGLPAPIAPDSPH